MTCASCAMRIEKKLNKLDGVTATVNYATEKARSSTRRPTRHRGADRRGREGRLHRHPPRTPGHGGDAADAAAEAGDPELTALRHRLIGSVVLPCR